MRRLWGDFWRTLFWSIRGVSPDEFRHICARCHRTGQVHYSWRGCWRYKRNKKQGTWCYCPGCGVDLVGQKGACIDDVSDADLTWYCCTFCDTCSLWNLDTPVPFVVAQGPAAPHDNVVSLGDYRR